MRRWRTVAAVVVVVVAVALAGCTGGDDPAPTPAATGGGSAQLLTAADGTTVVEFTAPGTGGYSGDVRVEVQSLTVDGLVMELRVALTPLGGDEKDDEGKISIYDMVDAYPVLSDVEHLKQYSLLKGWETDVVFAKTVVGEPILYQMWFAAPQDDVATLDLVISPEWPTVLDVPVSRA